MNEELHVRIQQELDVARNRLHWVAWATVAVVALSLPLSAAHATPVLIQNLVLIAGAIPIAIVAGRGDFSTMTRINLAGLALSGLLVSITITACALHHELALVVMISLQFVAAGALFFSTRWLVAYLALALGGSVGMLVATRHESDGVLVMTAAILGFIIHVALRDRDRRVDERYAKQLEAALELARDQLREKERAEREREAARSESEQYQGQLLQAQKMEAIGTLAGGVAHDMNNALAGIMGVADSLASTAPNDSVREDAEEILQAAKRAAELTRNLLGFSRRGQYRRERLDARTVIGSLVKLLGRTLPKGVTVETAFDEELAPFDGDASLLSHALINLCINASDAMTGRGSLVIGARMIEHDAATARVLGLEPGRHVALSVADTGTGMDAETQARIFEPFFTTKAVGQGTGLGLAMVYGTVKRHHGAIVVESALGRGTRFEIFLPIATARLASSEMPVASVRASSVMPVVAGTRVLVVDDESLVRRVVSRILERAGYVVTIAEDGLVGLDVLAREQGQFDLVLLDMAMPRMAGTEMFRAARTRYPELAVLLMSGYSSAEDARSLMAAGALGLVEKPFVPARLVEAVGIAVRGGRYQSSLEGPIASPEPTAPSEPLPSPSSASSPLGPPATPHTT